MAVENTRAESQNAPEEPRVQIQPAGDGSEEWGLVQFKILKVHLNQQPIDIEPWHAAGGEWTYFDCRTQSREAATFTVGVYSKPRLDGDYSWGKATILVRNRDEGAKLLDSVSRGFHERTPPPRTPQPLKPWTFSTAILGEHMQREPEGGFSGKPGDWVATKWFLERDGYAVEVFFNYNLASMAGEFSEKDTEYRADLLEVLNTLVRDGRVPERTPETDGNIALRGPAFGDPRLICEKARFVEFAPGGKFILYANKAADDSTALFAMPPEGSDEPLEIAHVERLLDTAVAFDSDARQLLLLEVLPREPGVFSSEDPERLWWVDRNENATRELKGPWEGHSFYLGDHPISPNGRFIAIKTWIPKTDAQRGNQSVIHILDRESGDTQVVTIQNQMPTPVDWVGKGAECKLAFTENPSWREGQSIRWYLADPQTGDVSTCEQSPLPSGDPSSPCSPDGSSKASLQGKEKIVITDLRSGQTQAFTIHEEDRQFVSEGCFEWVSTRYIALRLNRLAFLDTHSLKMNYPLSRDDDSSGHQFSADFRWVLWQNDDDKTFVAAINLPADAN